MARSSVPARPTSSQPNALGRRQFLGGAATGAAGLSMAAFLASCTTNVSGSGSGGGAGGDFPSHTKWKFVFVNHVTTNPFFVPTQYGIQDATSALGCTYQWTGSETSNVTEMVNAMNAAISGKADGIAVAITDPTAFNQPVANALAAGIPVVSYNADAPASSGNTRLAYLGQDLFASGVAVGERVVADVPSGDVVGFIATPGQLNIQPRIDGIKSAIQASGKPINFVQIATGAKVEDELSAIEAYYLGHKNVKGMYAVDAGSTQGVGQIVQKYNLAAAGVHSGGYDLLPTTLQLIQQGFLDFTIDQQPYQQGFYPTIQLFLYKLSGGLSQPSNTNTGLLFISKANVGPYLSSTSRFEGSTAQQKVIAG